MAQNFTFDWFNQVESKFLGPKMAQKFTFNRYNQVESKFLSHFRPKNLLSTGINQVESKFLSPFRPFFYAGSIKGLKWLETAASPIPKMHLLRFSLLRCPLWHSVAAAKKGAAAEKMAITCEIVGQSLKCAKEAQSDRPSETERGVRCPSVRPSGSESDNYDNCDLHNYGSRLGGAEGPPHRPR